MSFLCNTWLILNIFVVSVLGKVAIESAGTLINDNVFDSTETNHDLKRSLLTVSPLTNSAKLSILNQHNYYRNLTASGLTFNHPIASDMNQLFWDLSLEIIALKYASKCDPYHNNRRVSDLDKVNEFASWTYDIADLTIGETLYIGKHTDGLEGALYGMDLFYQEHEDYNYQSIKCDDNAKWGTCDHYKQIVSANTRYVGCGVHACDAMAIDGTMYYNVINFVCNYFPSFVPNQQPYKSDDEVCSQCDVDRVCAKDILQNEFNSLCGGCVSDSFIYCQDSSDLCHKIKPQCNTSTTLQKLCKTSCNTCRNEGIEGYKASKCCTNGIDDVLKCPMSLLSKQNVIKSVNKSHIDHKIPTKQQHKEKNDNSDIFVMDDDLDHENMMNLQTDDINITTTENVASDRLCVNTWSVILCIWSFV